MSVNEITWGRKQRPKKADQGHSAVRYGWLTDPSRSRSFYRCECGKRYSGRGEDGGARAYRSWKAHRDAEIEKNKNCSITAPHLPHSGRLELCRGGDDVKACRCCGLPYAAEGDLCPTCRNAGHLV
jgi:hypothetical protein